LSAPEELETPTHKHMAGLGVWLAFIGVCFLNVSALLQRLEHPVKADGSLSLVVIGDWGRKGTYNQSEVSAQVFVTLHAFFI